MSSCSRQHLLTTSNSLRHPGSWDLCDELQSAVCRGGFTLSRANQGKHPPPSKREGVDRQIESRVTPVITPPLPLRCKLLRLYTQSAEEQTRRSLLSNLLNSKQQQALVKSAGPETLSVSKIFFFFFKATRNSVMPPKVTRCKCLPPRVLIISNLLRSRGASSRGFLNFIKASTADYSEGVHRLVRFRSAAKAWQGHV